MIFSLFRGIFAFFVKIWYTGGVFGQKRGETHTGSSPFAASGVSEGNWML
jgi:hypothetical protein